MQSTDNLQAHVAEQVSDRVDLAATESWDNAHAEYRLTPDMKQAFQIGFLLGASYGANRITQAATKGNQ